MEFRRDGHGVGILEFVGAKKKNNQQPTNRKTHSPHRHENIGQAPSIAKSNYRNQKNDPANVSRKIARSSPDGKRFCHASKPQHNRPTGGGLKNVAGEIGILDDLFQFLPEN
jgi:hypothetical protein